MSLSIVMKTPSESSFWVALAAVIAWDCLIFSEISSYIRMTGFGGWCGTWALVSFYRMIFIGALSLVPAYFAIRSYRFFRAGMPPGLRLVVRLPLCCLVALLAAYFVAFPAVEGL